MKMSTLSIQVKQAREKKRLVKEILTDELGMNLDSLINILGVSCCFEEIINTS